MGLGKGHYYILCEAEPQVQCGTATTGQWTLLQPKRGGVAGRRLELAQRFGLRMSDVSQMSVDGDNATVGDCETKSPTHNDTRMTRDRSDRKADAAVWSSFRRCSPVLHIYFPAAQQASTKAHACRKLALSQFKKIYV